MLGLLIGALPASLGASLVASVMTGVVAGMISFGLLMRFGPRIDARTAGPCHRPTRKAKHVTAAVVVLLALATAQRGAWVVPVLSASFLVDLYTYGVVAETDAERSLRDWRLSSPPRWGLLWGAGFILAAGAIIAPDGPLQWSFVLLLGALYGASKAVFARRERRELAASDQASDELVRR